MSSTRIFKQAFVSGELSPELYGRVDIDRYASGVAKARNFIILPHGPAMNRPGFRFINEVKDSTKPVRLIPFSFSTVQTFAIEMGDHYIRFHTDAATLSPGAVAAYNNATAYKPGDLAASGGVNYYCTANTTGHAPPNASYWYPMPTGIYEVPSPYADDDLFSIKYEQSGDVITFTHPGYPIKELKRYSNTQWIFSDVVFASTMPAPTNCAASAHITNAGTNQDFYYGVTALNPDGFEESLMSAPSDVAENDLTKSKNYNTITWTAPTGAVTGQTRYNVYKKANGTFGYIGQTTELTFKDDNIIADMTRTVPINETFFGQSGDYPWAVARHEQRRFFAGSLNGPLNVWATQSASDNNMNYHIPTQDSDSLRFKIAASKANRIRHLVSLIDLIALTASTEWRIFAGGDNALTPSSITIKAQSQNGASNVQPVVVNNLILYEQAQGGHIREMSYQWQGNGYVSKDISVLSPHLFDGYQIVDMAFSRSPYPILWCVSTSGKLLGLTYAPEQQVAAWHQHDTDGVFESCCTVVEDKVEALYVVVRRTINGVQKRYIERLRNRGDTSLPDLAFVDCGLTYSGAPVTTIAGLDHLEGKIVAILGDGAVFPQQVVTGGSITLDYPVSKAQIGLPYVSDLKALPIAWAQEAAQGRSRVKNINQVWVRVKNSGLFQAGPDEDRLTQFKWRTLEPYGSPPELRDGEMALVIKSNWNQDGAILIRQDQPLPLTVVDLTIEASIGG